MQKLFIFRYAAVRACKWVDEIVVDAPYVTQLEIMDAYGCELCVHGDDISTTADGSDSYAAVKNAGRFATVKRTECVSTTELVGRMLLMTRDHHIPSEISQEISRSPYTNGGVCSRLMPTAQRIAQFSARTREFDPSNDRVIYVDGAFDLFHAGHAELLRRARELGTFVVVGLHDDATINRIRGSNLPVMNLQERLLGVLSCKYVDDVIIGAPYSVSKEFLLSGPFKKIAAVVHGVTSCPPDLNGNDPYDAAKELDIYHEIETPFSYLSAQSIIERVIQSRAAYEERNRKKEAKELATLRLQSNAKQ